MGWEAGVPSSKRIVEDMLRIPNYSILKQFKARGVLCLDAALAEVDMMKESIVGVTWVVNNVGKITKTDLFIQML
eukprot:640352-Ditylum_brightwellii.AAC.2